MSINSMLTDISSVQTAINGIANNTSLLKKISDIDFDFETGFHFVGIGKSLLAANKTAASIRSIGFRASAYHAVDYLHGDIGNVNIHSGDLIFFITNSGKTAEVVNAISYTISLLGEYNRTNKTIFTISSGQMEPDLVRYENQLLYDPVKEMEPNNVILPNISVFVTMLIGDLITNELIRKECISNRDFALNHPGGDIGVKTLLEI